MIKIEQKVDDGVKPNEESQAKKSDQNWRYLLLLKQAGLDEKEALVFEILLDKGELGAGDIIRFANLKRGDAYNHIYSLKQKGLIAQRSVRGRMKFSLEHPSLIEGYLEKRSSDVKEAEKGLQAAMPAILSTYNLSYHKPGVKVFEGEEAIQRIMSDSLTSKTEIYEYLDPSEVDKYLLQANRKYVAKRIERKIVKKMIVPDTNFSKERYMALSSKYTHVKLLSFPISNFQTVMQIYDNKVSYLTLSGSSIIGVIIEDPYIFKMHKSLFEVSFIQAKNLHP